MNVLEQLSDDDIIELWNNIFPEADHLDLNSDNPSKTELFSKAKFLVC
jgi:hypothetical protein